jgi:exonuclease SbcD|nr:MAG TPA: STRUCTURAL MAINTENANCE OF CHROMOSOMES PROTEIN [Caudoviricetes sp.]
MKILHTADWHIGDKHGPSNNGVNLRAQDTLNCLNELVRVAKEEKPDLVLVSGDIFDTAEIMQRRSHQEVLQARNIIFQLSKAAGNVIVMRGTPNHDSEWAFEELKGHFELVPNVQIVTQPQVITLDGVSVAVLPGFDRGVFRAKYPGLGKEEENEVLTGEISNIVKGLKTMCGTDDLTILMAHYTVPGCNVESGQVMMLTQFEPIIPVDALTAADYDLVALGHIHRPQQLFDRNWYYSGAVNALTFNDEGQERGFYIHNYEDGVWNSVFHRTPYREFKTTYLDEADMQLINEGQYDIVGMQHWKGNIDGKIVRVLYNCTFETNKAVNKALFERKLLEDGAFQVTEINPQKISESADRQDLSDVADPEENLKQWLIEKNKYSDEKIQELILIARPIIQQAQASMSQAGVSGVFEPVEIAVKNYRNYVEETFNFNDISFCTINGQNGAGKSSLFMDAIVDCLYEKTREDDITGWIRNDEKVRSGSIMFTFRIGDKTFRVTRTRTRSRKGTLNLSELVSGEWVDRSKEKTDDTQKEIINILGMDNLTFKSCALIMQDQYGLFLQTPKAERMIVLGNLLGLGVYQAMEKLAYESKSRYGSQAARIVNEINVHSKTISDYGNPQESIDEAKQTLDIKLEELERITRERDSEKVLLMSMQEAQERADKISLSISSLIQKKLTTDENMRRQSDIRQQCKSLLEDEKSITSNAGRYRELETRKKELIESTTLFNSKMAEVAKANSTCSALETDLERSRAELKIKQTQLSAYEDVSGDDEILAKASEYADKKAELDRLKEQAVVYQKAKSDYSAAIFNRDETERTFENELRLADEKKKVLEQKVAILNESDCVDIDNAHCRFLQDAIAAKEQLVTLETTYADISARRESELTKCNANITDKANALSAIKFNADYMLSVQSECEELLPFVAKAETVKQKANSIALIKTSIEHMQSNISEYEKRLDMAILESQKAKSELDMYRDAFNENEKVTEELEMLKPWLEKEKQLPVIKERDVNAATRLSELEAQKAEIELELAGKQTELADEMKKTVDMASKKQIVDSLNTGIAGIDSEIKAIQMNIGAYTQKLTEIEKLQKLTAELTVQLNEARKNEADYELLKTSFSQDGIPHQIVRTIIPKLTDTANSILGQMTGGKMGVEFKTEKTQKSNSKKEVVTLDIFINEYGKSSLPYLSKSGGEKVKASLSVILALAEIKSSTAGIQLGMLFIDEPPFLDADGIQAYCDALETIQSRYPDLKVMAITHDPTMKARFPQSVDVIKTDEGSKVIY